MAHPLADPASPEIQQALTRECRVCKGKPQHFCTNLTDGQPLTGRLVHHDRTSK